MKNEKIQTETEKKSKTYKHIGITYGEGKWGNEFADDPTIGQFKRLFDQYAADAGDDVMHSHNIPTSVRIVCINPDDEHEYRIVALEMDSLGACGCTCGINILIARVDEEDTQ